MYGPALFGFAYSILDNIGINKPLILPALKLRVRKIYFAHVISLVRTFAGFELCLFGILTFLFLVPAQLTGALDCFVIFLCVLFVLAFGSLATISSSALIADFLQTGKEPSFFVPLAEAYEGGLRDKLSVLTFALVRTQARLAHFLSDWILSTNHRRIAVLYFAFVAISGFTGLILATIIRIELAYPGQFFLAQNAERYLTLISIHGIVMVFFMIIPAIFGAFGNFLLPTQLGIRDVAFPRLNSFMF